MGVLPLHLQNIAEQTTVVGDIEEFVTEYIETGIAQMEWIERMERAMKDSINAIAFAGVTIPGCI